MSDSYEPLFTLIERLTEDVTYLRYENNTLKNQINNLKNENAKLKNINTIKEIPVKINPNKKLYFTDSYIEDYILNNY